MTNLQALLSLQHTPNLGDISIKKMIEVVGSAEGVLKEKKENLLKIEGIGQVKIASIHDAIHYKAAELEMNFILKNNIKVHLYKGIDYPKYLKECIDCPIVLFSTGNIAIESPRIISIVGTRKITHYGKQFCEELIADLAIFNPIIVSGFAYGVDIAAHKLAFQHKLQTIACLGHGLNQIYPKNHKQYMLSVEENGGFYSDFWSTDAFTPQNFLRRNRIIAGLSQATIVIESAEKGGSLATAQMANSYNRDVFAVPGRSSDPFSLGCNTLIKTQQAHLLTSSADLVYMLNWEMESKVTKAYQQQLFVELNDKEQLIYNCLQEKGKQDLDSLSIQCNIPTYALASILLNLELKNVVKPLPGKLFEVI